MANVADPVAAATIVGDAVAHFGGIDAVAHCAGILRDAIWHRMSLDAWRAVIDVHLNGAFHLAQAATPHFREQGSGSFVFFTSGAGLVGNVGQANYAAAKLGVVGLAQSIALDMRRHGVRANCIAPIAWTRMMAGVPGAGDADDPATEGLRALGPDRVAPLAVYLMADAAREVSNQIFGVCGDEISVFAKPRPVARVARDAPWTAQAIAEEAMLALRPHLARADEVAADVFRLGDAEG
jgi:NAD(P)-dependent dehydrogenase (short-subunit alcohol dehydrogenase family)